MGPPQAPQEIFGLTTTTFRDVDEAQRGREACPRLHSQRRVLNETDAACGCDFLFLQRALSPQALRSKLVVAGRGYSCRCLLPQPGTRGGASPHDWSARPKRRQSEDSRRCPLGTRCPGLMGFFLGTVPAGLGSGKARGFCTLQGTVGFKLKIPARPQLSLQGPRPRRASPGPLDFRRLRSPGDVPGLGGGLRTRPSQPPARPPSPGTQPRATYPAGSVRERGAAGSAGRAALLLPASRAAPERGGAGAGPGHSPPPRPVPSGPAAGAAPGPATSAGGRRTILALPSWQRAEEPGLSPVGTPSRTPSPGAGGERCRGGSAPSPLSPLAPGPQLPSPLSSFPEPRHPPPRLPRPGSHPRGWHGAASTQGEVGSGEFLCVSRLGEGARGLEGLALSEPKWGQKKGHPSRRREIQGGSDTYQPA